MHLSPEQNVAPVARNDSGSMSNDMTASFNVLQNDSDINNDELNISIENTLSLNGGTVAVIDSKMLRYNPPAGYVGEDSVNYSVYDGHGGNQQQL